MSLYRGAGGASDATDDSTVNAVAGYASAAASSASAAATSATEASNSATASASSASSAATSASSVATDATNAANSAAFAANSAAIALIYRNSTFTNRNVAQTAAGNASVSASDAATSASTASTQATNAANSATAAATSAADAATSASNAASSASSALAIYGNTTAMSNAVAAAATSASNASTSAANANDSKVLAEAAVAGASSYASSAQSSANSAATSASSALAIYGNTSAMNQAVQTATTSAATAVSSASSATTSATNAAASATSASSSATSAAASAAAASAVVLGNEPVRPTIRPSLLLDFANTKQLDPRITFTRASTATYYDGKTTAIAEQNLMLRSQEFDNATWIKGNSSVTANATSAPDGTTTADQFVENSATGLHQIYQDHATASVLSFYAKASGRTIVGTYTNNGVYCSFDLTAVTATGTGASITDVGNGWRRCVVTSAGTFTRSVIGPSTSTVTNDASWTYAGDGTSGIYLWGAQVEQRSAVTAYTATTTAPITNYIPALQTAASGVARFDHAPAANPTTSVSAGESLGLLIEEQRTNLLTYSDQFDNAVWSKTRSSVTANTVVAPDGTLNGDKLVEDTTATSSHELAESVSGLTAQVYTFSVYAKAAGRSVLQMTFSGNGGSGYANFDLSSGVLGTVGNSAVASITSVGNGWYRCSIASGSAFSAGSCSFVVMSQTSTTAARYGGYTGDGYSGLYIWGAQVEAGAFATSYIPTTSAQVTRSADAASMTGTNFSSWFNAGAGTLYSEAYVSPNSGVCYGATISDNTASNAINIGQYNGRNNLGYIKTSGVDQALLSSNATQATGSYLKQAMAFAYNDAADSPNGAAVATDTSVVLPSVNRLDIGGWAAVSTVTLNGTIKKIAYYPARVTNAQLQGMTTV